MNKNYKVNTNFGQAKRVEREEGDKVFTSLNGANTFSYKGIPVMKRGGCYTVKDVKLQGYAPWFLAGVFTDGRSLKIALESALSGVDKEKYCTFRAKNQNIQCPHCRSIYLLYKTMQFKRYGDIYIECPHCYEVHALDDVNRVTDEKVY
ncbi:MULTISPECIES: hypothetical protein [Serratia]|uniref:Uncharacterized protein n=1 Tax=Serratia odorifera DSM 4582 TaxID=667129 RepID=D4E3V5_SEROD|nr:MULTISPECIES: hypothetical protein [Serratia]EFE95653.1 hypothetical protein HMPREF0758_2855 [Serratia odorifera DSM 4582]PNK90198.1 hypothetical protein CEQ31_011050 [Serratia odorifera]RII71361.1 hypothetical protein DX901_15275 [Serratia odorifera]